MDQELNNFLDRVGARALCPTAVDELKQHVGPNAEVWEGMNNPAWMLQYAKQVGVSKEVIRAAIDEINNTSRLVKINKYDCEVIRKHMPAVVMQSARIKKTAELDEIEAKEIEKEILP